MCNKRQRDKRKWWFPIIFFMNIIYIYIYIRTFGVVKQIHTTQTQIEKKKITRMIKCFFKITTPSLIHAGKLDFYIYYIYRAYIYI